MKNLSFKKFAITIIALVTLSYGANAQLTQTITLNDGDDHQMNWTPATTGQHEITFHVASGTATLSGVVANGSGITSLVKTGGGTLVITSAQTYGGSTTVNGGTLTIGNGGTTGSISNSTFIILKQNISNLAANCGRLTVNRSNNYTISTVISGTGNGAYGAQLIKQGAGMLYLTAANTYPNGTLVQQGTLSIGNSSTTGSITGNVTVSSGTTLSFYRSNNYTYSGVISGAGNVTHAGNSQLTLGGVNTYTGKTTVTQNLLIIGTSGSILNTNEITLTGASSWVSFNPTSNVTYSMPITGAGSVQKWNSGNLTITQPQYTGATEIHGTGRLVVANNSSFPSSNVQTFDLTASVAFSVAEGSTLQYNGVISGTGDLLMSGGGKLILTATNTYTGGTHVSGGVLQVNNGSINSTSNVELWETVPASVLRFEITANTTFSKVISGVGNVEKAGGLALYLIHDNTFDGTTTIEAGTLYLGASGGSTTGSVTGNIVNNALLYFSRSNNYTYSGVISGTGMVRKATSGAGIITLNGANTYTGTTAIYYGTLALGANGTIANSSAVYLSGATAKFDISAGNKTIKALNGTNSYPNAEVVLGTRTLTIGTNGGTDGGGEYYGKITGSVGSPTTVAIRKYGSAELTLGGTASTYNGTTNIAGGTLTFAAAGSLGTGWITFNGGTLKWATGNTDDISSRLNTSTNPTFDIGSNNVTFASVLPTISTAATKTGTGKLTLTAANPYTVATTIGAGTLALGGTAGELNGNVVVSAGATFEYARTNAYIYSKVISGAGTILLSGTGDLTLTGTNTNTGTITINSGSLYVGNAGTTGSIANPNVVVNGTSSNLRFNRSNSYIYNGIISGTGNVIHDGTGLMILGGANTYTGMTGIISTGTLELNTTGSIAQSPLLGFYAGGKFKISSDKTIGCLITVTGSGSEVQLGGMLTLNDTANFGMAIPYNGIISGTGGINKIGNQILKLESANTYTGTTTINNGTLELGTNGTIANSDNVTIGANGKLDITAGNKTIQNLNASAAAAKVNLGGNTLTIGSSAGSGDGGGTFNGIFEGTNGKVIKFGILTFTMTGNNTATGLFTLSSGGLGLSKWAGAFTQAGSTNLNVIGNAAIGGALTFLSGSAVTMDLTQATPSKITATGAVSATGVTLNVTTGAQASPIVLIQAASGISTANYTLTPIAGITATLGSVGTTQLTLANATVTDNTPPTAGAGVTLGTVTAETVNLSWTAATDLVTPQASLNYSVYRSSSNNIGTVANCEANGTLLNAGGTVNLTSYQATGLTPNTTYYFNVVVKDNAGNKAAYTALNATTSKADLTGTATITGNAVFGETLTANPSLSSTPNIPNLGTLTYQWKRGAANIGTNSATYTLVQADINSTITVVVTAANCNGNVTSSETATVIKASQTAPAAPVSASVTHNSITLTAIAGCEYRMDGGAWQSSTTFSGLTPETEYLFEARKAETATHFASPESASTPIETAAAPIPDKVYQGIQQVQAINAPYNSPKTEAGLSLPASVTINTDQGSVAGVAITWNVAAANYTVGADPEQTFLVTGAIGALPAGVINPNSVSLSTTVTVTVAARPLNPQVTNVAVSPASVSVQQGMGQLFYAVVTAVDYADESVDWTITGQNSVNTTISAAGYLNIDASENATTITVKATSVFNPTKFGTATVTVTTTPVTPQVNSVVVTPALADVEQGHQQQFTTIVDAQGGASTAVNWSVEGAISQYTVIDASGALTVGADESATTITVKAVSQFNSTKFGTATVTVIPAQGQPDVIDVKILPNPAAVEAGASLQFTVEVLAIGGADESVSWYVEDNVSAQTTITAGGLLSVAADETAETVKVRAVSNFNPAIFDEVTVSITTVGIQDLTFSTLSVYPNPTATSVTITNAEGADLKIMDISGKTLKAHNIISASQEVSVSTLPNGVYMFCLTKNGNVKVVKIVKM